MKKKRMAFVDLCNYHDWPMGGMLQYERMILETLTERFSVELWGVSVDGIPPEPLVIGGDFFPISIFANVRRGSRLIPNYWKGLTLGRHRKQMSGYDVIYLHTGSCAAAAAIFLRTHSNMLVYHQHGLSYLSDRSLKILLQRPFMFLAQKMTDFSFVVTGREELENYISSGRESLRRKLVAVGSPTECACPDTDQREKDETDCIFLYVGRLAPIKRIPMLIESFALFCRRHGTSCRLDLVGDGEERRAAERQILKYGLQDQVRLVGAVPPAEVSQYYFAANVFVTASAGEGVSLAVLEAFCAGLPAVCFSVRGLREQVRDGVTGAVADSDDPESFSAAMERAFEKRHEMSENCRREGQKFGKEAVGRQIAEEIERRYGKNYGHHPSL